MEESDAPSAIAGGALAQQYNALLTGKLLPHQQRLEASLREVEAALQDIDALQRNIATLATQSSKNLKTLVNLGSEMYMRAVVPDASRICVEVGLGFYAEFTLHEAQQFLRKKREATERRKATLDEQLAETTAHAHTVQQLIAQIPDMLER